MAVVVYLLCGATSMICTILLARTFRHTKNRLVFWSALCFACLTLNNILLVADFMIFPEMDLSAVRIAPLVVGSFVMMYGLVWDTV